MASPPIVPSLLHLAARPFSFYPAIAGVAHNEWRLQKATWQDWLVVNSRTSEELSIPRRYVGEVSSTDHPVLIVGLVRELQCKDGIALPCERRLIEMPLAVGAENSPRPRARSGGPAPVIGIRLEPRRRNRVFQLVGGALAVAIFLYVATANLIRTAARRSASVSARPVSNPVLVPGLTRPSGGPSRRRF
jgi:hypothetical protein